MAFIPNQLFNATSLREARKGMALNRSIYVFTVVTIMYTPLGFMAVGPTAHMPTSTCSGKYETKKTPRQTFWALPILNTASDGENSRPSGFGVFITFIIIPGLTYVACAWMAWYFTSRRTGETFTAFLMKGVSLVTTWTKSALARRKTAGSTGSPKATSEV